MTETEEPTGVRTYRSIGGLIIVGIIAALMLFLLGDAVVRGGWLQALLLAPWPLLALWVAYEAAASSYVRLDAAGVTVQNMVRRTTFGWRHLRAADFRWQLEFLLDDDTKVTAMGGPARSRPRRQTTQEHEVEGERVPSGIRAVTEIHDRRDAAGDDADAAIVRTWDWPAVIAFAVLVVWAAVALIVTR